MDNNVTRHVAPELARTDWEVMVLHYLGLDHIGHSAGPKRYKALGCATAYALSDQLVDD